MTDTLTRCKTVRFDQETWQRIEIAARDHWEVTTSEYIRDRIKTLVEHIDLKQVLPEPEAEG